MNHVYEKYDDQHVMGTYVYAKANDAYAYEDAAYTKKIKKATLKELFLRGIFVVSGTVIYKAVALKEDTTENVITYVKADTTTATTAVLATLKSYDA